MTQKLNADLAVIILAAGQGTRMKSVLPKVLHQIGGRSLLGHVLDTAFELEPGQVAVVVRHERDQVASAIDADDTGVIIVDQDEIPGTGRAVQLALAALGEFAGDVLVLSGDVPLLEASQLSQMIELHRSEAAAATMMTAIMGDPSGYGRVIRDSAGLVDRIVEQKDANPAEAAVTEINAGVYLFQAPQLRTQLELVTSNNAQGERYLTDVIALLRAAGESIVASLAPDASLALGVNDRVQLSEAARLLNERIVRKWQREGVTVLDPASTWIDATATLAPDVTLLPGTFILRATTVASGAVIGPDTTLTDCEVGPDARINRTEANLSVIGAGATVGPFAYLRPGTELGANGKIGTFTETKNAIIGEGSKVPHLSYIGDAEIGVGSNIGAGTIVANYDGVNKHRTTVGSHVRTGSHNVFVAPVSIGDGAYTGAGTVVRKDVPSGALSISIAPQRNIDGWVAKNRPGTAAAEAAEEG